MLLTGLQFLQTGNKINKIMRKIFINNDRSQIAFFHSVLDSAHVVVESLAGELSIHAIETVGMLDLTEREHYEFMVVDEKRSFETQKEIFVSLISKSDNQETLSDEEIINICSVSKRQADIFINQYKENNQ